MKAINLLPPDLRGAPKGAAPVVAADEPGGLGAFVVLGTLALCVAALAAYVLTTNTVKDREAQLEAVGAQAQATAQRVAQLKPYADFQAMAETRIQTVRDLASSRFDWEQALRDISRAIPANVTLNSLNGSISSGAGGGSGMRGAISAPAVELKGCTTGQKAVATLMSRLRGVDGVTRVTLGKSLKPEAVAETGLTAVAPGSGTGCGAGRPPAFELVIFFERSEVPATIEDLTVQAQAGATSAPAAAGAAAETQP
ncbi:MAG: PilN domain-containing protein, partial [Solirubrobacteraceae bacterium]